MEYISTVGTVTSTNDEIVSNLIGKIEEVIECCPKILEPDSDCVIEVEGRLGMFINDKQRIKLPVTTNVVLDYPSDKFYYKFESGIADYQFFNLIKAVNSFFGIDAPDVLHPPLFTKVGDDNLEVLDMEIESITVPGLTLQNFSVDIPQEALCEQHNVRKRTIVDNLNSESIECIWKDKKQYFNIFSGMCTLDDSEDNYIDYRISINVEHRVPLTVVEGSPSTFKSKKHRLSYPINKNYFIDATVTSLDQSAGKTKNLYEVELEMNPVFIYNYITTKDKESSKPFWDYTKQFVNILRSFIHFLRSPMTKELNVSHKEISKTIDLTEVAQSVESVEKYKKYIGPTLPLIGDYLFRAL